MIVEGELVIIKGDNWAVGANIRGFQDWINGVPIGRALPTLTLDDRELLEFGGKHVTGTSGSNG